MCQHQQPILRALGEAPDFRSLAWIATRAIFERAVAEFDYLPDTLRAATILSSAPRRPFGVLGELPV